jgi:hypothetical protein
MKLYFIVIIVASCIASRLQAQVNKPKTWNLSIGADALFPENNFKKTHGLGYGLSIKAEYLVAKHASVTISSGYYSLSSKTNMLNPNGDIAVGIPIKGGLRYYLGNFYIGGEFGWLNQFNFLPRDGFVYSFSLGDEIVTKKNGNSLDISVRHEAWKTDNTRAFVGLRLAYEFRLN